MGSIFKRVHIRVGKLLGRVLEGVVVSVVASGVVVGASVALDNSAQSVNVNADSSVVAVDVEIVATKASLDAVALSDGPTSVVRTHHEEPQVEITPVPTVVVVPTPVPIVVAASTPMSQVGSEYVSTRYPITCEELQHISRAIGDHPKVTADNRAEVMGEVLPIVVSNHAGFDISEVKVFDMWARCIGVNSRS